MARLWSSGGELQSATSGIEWDTTTGTVAISTSIKRSGAASIRCNPTVGSGYVQHRVRADATGRIFLRCYLFIVNNPNADTQVLSWSDTGTSFPSIVLKSNGKLQARSDAAFIGSETAALSAGQWYRLELDYNDGASDVTSAYLDGAQFCNAANGGDIAGGGVVEFGARPVTGNVTCDLYFDDIAMNDTTGSFQTGLAGSGRIVHMKPDADGADKQWQDQASGTQGTSTFANIDDSPTPDDVTTYNKRTTNSPTTTPLDTWNCESSSSAGIGPTDSITLVQVGVRAGSTSTTSTGRTIAVRIYQGGGSAGETTGIPVNVNGWTTHSAAADKPYGVTIYQDLDSAVPITTARLDVLQIGVKADVSSTNEIRYSMLWALVEFESRPLPTRRLTTPSAVQRALI